MNRKEEYETLLRELEQTPPRLEFTVTRAEARGKKRRTLRLWGVPVASLGGVFAAFVLLVNLSLPFALACVETPLLKELMAAVAVAPSIKAMVKNDFIQPMNMTQEADGASMTIHYLAYDGTEVHIFYTATYNGSDRVEIFPEYTLPNGEPVESISYSSGMPPEKGELGHMNLHLYRQELPPALTMQVGIHPRTEGEDGDAPRPALERREWSNPDDEVREEPAVVLDFQLEFDQTFTTAKRTYTPHTPVTIDGRTITLETVTVYPTGTQVEFSDGEGNDAWLKGLDLWLEDGRGNQIERKKNGVVSSGGTGEFVPTYWLESSYFDPEAELTLCIEGATWLEKGRESMTLDLARPQDSESLPGIRLEQVVREGADVKLIFHSQDKRSMMSNIYVTPEGETGYTNVWGSRSLNDADPSQPPFEEYTYLWDYPWDTVEMGLHYTQTTRLSQPLRIPLG